MSVRCNKNLSTFGHQRNNSRLPVSQSIKAAMGSSKPRRSVSLVFYDGTSDLVRSGDRWTPEAPVSNAPRMKIEDSTPVKPQPLDTSNEVDQKDSENTMDKRVVTTEIPRFWEDRHFIINQFYIPPPAASVTTTTTRESEPSECVVANEPVDDDGDTSIIRMDEDVDSGSGDDADYGDEEAKQDVPSSDPSCSPDEREQGDSGGQSSDSDGEFRVQYRKPVGCDFCGKIFTSQGNLNQHISSVHLKRKIGRCGHCGRAFSEKGSLKKHIATVHLNVVAGSCGFCGKTFAQKGNLKFHIDSVHLKVKIGACDFCGKEFSHRGGLRKHILNFHCDKVPYSCGSCGETFVMRQDLDRHIARFHSKRKMVNCDYCGKLFTKEISLVNHMASVHHKELMSPDLPVS